MSKAAPTVIPTKSRAAQRWRGVLLARRYAIAAGPAANPPDQMAGETIAPNTTTRNRTAPPFAAHARARATVMTTAAPAHRA